ncbi:helix-turn-helix domain-containing protein [Pseudonocardia sp. H11422]|uniref:helix-turn-helix domain-containing protein n=1 Tax=Pseudonocardia sp. H11422 TaxID=2835866 RepID=UPI001BDBB2CB|nr:helix-turn-helix domain-containing protein [Pseudonocardia sp. H11422]
MTATNGRGTAGSGSPRWSAPLFLAEKRRVQTAAEALSIHMNTLRYRLEKYSSITGADLTDTEVLIEVWWT